MRTLGTITAEQACKQNLAYIKGRKEGTIRSVRSKFTRLDSELMGGFEENTITTIGAISGGGKSTLSKVLRNSFIYNNDIPMEYLCFNMEMLAHNQIARQATSAFEITLQKLYSTEEPLDEETYKSIAKYYKEDLSKMPITFVEEVGNPEEIIETIYEFWKQKCKEENKLLIYEIDHTLLTKGKDGENEKEVIDRLMKLAINLKKQVAFEGGRTLGLVLSQLNREIKRTERIVDPIGHVPRTSDIFGASSVEHASDYILIQHMPAKLGIESYTDMGYPTKLIVTDGDEEYEEFMIYLHLIKNRSGRPDSIFPIKNKLQFFDLDEVPLDEFNLQWNAFQASGFVKISK